jgi:hypothetical protein
VALAVRTAPSGLSLGLRLGGEPRPDSGGHVQLYADGVLRDSRVLVLDPQRKTDISIDDIDDPDHPASVVEVRLLARDETDSAARRWAWTTARGHRPAREPSLDPAVGGATPTWDRAVLSPDGNTAPPRDYARDVIGAMAAPGTWSSSRATPAELPATPILASRRPSSPLGTVSGPSPGIGSLDQSDPIRATWT